jgi:aminoglycoside 6'-N-acetyltransferase I
MGIDVRLATARDVEALADLRVALWPEGTREEHAADAAAIVAGRPASTMPLVIYVAEVDRLVAGFVEVGLRSHAEGCDTRRPAGFIEGWFVVPRERGRGVGRALIAAAEAWCRGQGCTELASDTWHDNDASIRAHQALGFEVVERTVCLRKAL